MMDYEHVEGRLKQFLDKPASIDPTAYVHPSAVIMGDVRIGAKASIWPNVVLRGDINFIEIGEGSNIQDGSVIHLSDDHPVKVGKYVTVGHMAMLHACTIEDECLIGMGAIILDGAVIGKNSIIGAGALVREGEIIPPGSLVVGNPGVIKRTLDDARRASLKTWALKYVVLAAAVKTRA